MEIVWIYVLNNLGFKQTEISIGHQKLQEKNDKQKLPDFVRGDFIRGDSVRGSLCKG